jgi:hypothetical protein
MIRVAYRTDRTEGYLDSKRGGPHADLSTARGANLAAAFAAGKAVGRMAYSASE